MKRISILFLPLFVFLWLLERALTPLTYALNRRWDRKWRSKMPTRRETLRDVINGYVLRWEDIIIEPALARVAVRAAKAIVLLPMWPLIGFALLLEDKEACRRRGEAMLAWYRK